MSTVLSGMIFSLGWSQKGRSFLLTLKHLREYRGKKYLPYAGSHQHSMVCDLFKCKKIESRPITHRGFLSRHHHVGGGSDGPYIYGLHFSEVEVNLYECVREKTRERASMHHTHPRFQP